jgi:hypothetical protein
VETEVEAIAWYNNGMRSRGDNKKVGKYLKCHKFPIPISGYAIFSFNLISATIVYTTQNFLVSRQEIAKDGTIISL